MEEVRMVHLAAAGISPIAQLADENDVSFHMFHDLVDSLTPADKAHLRQDFVDTVLHHIRADQRTLEAYAGPDADALNEPVLRLVLKGVCKLVGRQIRECHSLLVVRISTLDQQQMFNDFISGVFRCISPERITSAEGFGGLPRPMWTNVMADNDDIPLGLRNSTSVIFSGMVNPQPPDVVLLHLPHVPFSAALHEARRCVLPVWILNSLQDVWFRMAMVDDEHDIRVIQYVAADGVIQYVAADGGEVWGGALEEWEARRVGNQEVIDLTGDD
jgi:hypothetical protein